MIPAAAASCKELPTGATSVVFSSSHGNIGAVIRRQPDERPTDAVVEKIAQARCFRNHDHHQCRKNRDRTDEAGGEERNNEEAYSLEWIGIDARPVRRNDTDGKRNARGHDGHNKRKDNDKDPAKQGHIFPF